VNRRLFLLTTSASMLPLPSGAVADPSVYARKVLGKRPVGYWRLGEASGDVAADASGMKHDGHYKGSTRLAEGGALKKEPNTAVKFDGSTAYVEVADSDVFSQPTSGNGLTVEAWMRPDALTFDGETSDPHVHWLGKGEPGQHEWGFRFYSLASSRPNRISAYIWNPNGDLGSGAYFQESLTAGEWIHVVACFDPGDARDRRAGVSIYRNGRFVGGPSNQPGSPYKAYNITPAGGSAPVRFGTRNLKSFFNGALDEVAIYPRVLRPAEIIENYRSAR
jgi:hypothetical protein